MYNGVEIIFVSYKDSHSKLIWDISVELSLFVFGMNDFHDIPSVCRFGRHIHHRANKTPFVIEPDQ